jgi:basic membrane protein A
MRCMPGRGIVASLILGTLLVGCGSSSSAPPPTITPSPTPIPIKPKGPFTAVLVTDVSGIHDRSFNQLAWQGLQRAGRRYGVHARYIESRSAGDYRKNLDRAAAEGGKLILAVGGSMALAVHGAALAHSRIGFALVDARPQDGPGHPINVPNVANLLFREQESGYLAGVVAGLMEKGRIGHATHNTIGYVGGSSMSAVDDYLAGYVAGAKRVDPTISVKGQYAGSFTDETAGSTIAGSQIDAGADILFQVAALTGVGYLDAARQRGAYGIGVDSDQSYLGPHILTSAIKRVDVAVVDIVRRTREGRFLPYDHFYGMAQGATGLAPLGKPVPPSIRSQVQQYARRIISRSVVPPTSLPAR